MFRPPRTARSMVVLLFVGAALVAGCGDSPTSSETFLEQELGQALRATARYEDVAVAIREGFVADPICVASPAGGMGIHYVNEARIDTMLNIVEPEVLLYIPEGGRLKLIALEYFVPVMGSGGPHFGPGPPGNTGTHPELFGVRFDGPMPGHSPVMPWHFDLHVWNRMENPAGMFAAWNPRVRCS